MKTLRILGIFTAVIAVVIGLFFAADQSRSSFPSVESYEPSGFAAFAELARRDGHQVVLDHRSYLMVRPNDLLITVELLEPEAESYFALDDPLGESLRNFLKDGGSVLSIKMPKDFNGASLKAESLPIYFGSQDLTMTKSSFKPGLVFNIDYPLVSQWIDVDDWTTLVEDDEEAEIVARANAFNLLQLHEGLLATNRYIDQADNAEILLRLLRAAKPKGGRIVFLESSWGNVRNPNIVGVLGGWAMAARNQVYLLVLVILVTLAIRFGAARPERTGQRGSRELVDSIAEHLLMGKRRQLAIMTIRTEALHRVRRALKLSRLVSDQDVLARCPDSLAAAINKVTFSHGRKREFVEAMKNLDAEIVAFEHDNRRARAAIRP